jgi:hypothetical protein
MNLNDAINFFHWLMEEKQFDRRSAYRYTKEEILSPLVLFNFCQYAHRILGK